MFNLYHLYFKTTCNVQYKCCVVSGLKKKRFKWKSFQDPMGSQEKDYCMYIHAITFTGWYNKPDLITFHILFEKKYYSLVHVVTGTPLLHQTTLTLASIGTPCPSVWKHEPQPPSPSGKSLVAVYRGGEAMELVLRESAVALNLTRKRVWEDGTVDKQDDRSPLVRKTKGHFIRWLGRGRYMIAHRAITVGPVCIRWNARVRT